MILSGLFIFFRGPYISNTLKRLILPELSLATGRDVTAKKIYINIIPLFIEARDIKVYDSGRAIITIPRVKGYIGIGSFLRKEINIRRLVISSPELKTERTIIEDIIRKVNEYMKIQRDLPFKVKIRGINIRKGVVDLIEKDSLISLKGASGEIRIIPTGAIWVDLSIFDSRFSLKDWPLLSGSISSSFFINRDSVDLKNLAIMINGSEVHSSGHIPSNIKDGELKTRLRVLMETLKGVFGLKKRGEGEIEVNGLVRFLRDVKGIRSDPFNSISVDLDLKGGLYIQSLLELVRVREKIEGLVDFSGNLKGPLSDLTGHGRATMRDGNLFGVAVKRLMCNVGYKDGMLSFSDGRASLYNGTAQATASVQIHGGNFYSVDVKAQDIDSEPLLDLIGWRPDIPHGKVLGDFKISGNGFNPSGWFEYKSLAPKGNNVLRRIRTIKGSYTMERDVLTLQDARAETGLSELNIEGKIDIASSSLDLQSRLFTRDIADIASPSLEDVTGSGIFYGTVKGRFDDPVISGHISAEKASLYHHGISMVEGDVVYRKKELLIKDASFRRGDSEIRIKGSISFPEAKELFDLGKPSYNLSAMARNLQLSETAPIFLKDLQETSISGLLNADLSIKGTWPELRGHMKLQKPSINTISFDSASASFIYEDGNMKFNDLMIKSSSPEKESIVQGNGAIYSDRTIQFRIKGDVSVASVLPHPRTFDIAGNIDFLAGGRGRLDNPEIDITASLTKGRIRTINIGSSSLKAYIRDRELSFESLLFNEKAAIKGRLNLRDISWSARIELRSGRYDSLIEAILKDVPEDLLVNIRGYVDLKGKRDHFNAKGFIDELNIHLYGYSFASEKNINFSMEDWRIKLPPVKMRSGATSFDVQGIIDINREIDISLEGRSNLSPLKGFSRKIDIIRGEAEFVLSITGRWDSPKINGGLGISNGFVGIKGISHRLSNAKGYIYIDEDRIVIDKITGNIGGGEIDISGITYLKGFKMRRFYIDSVVNNMTLNISKDFPVNFNGNLLFRGTADSRTLSGEIRVKKARYRERVEWKSWLLKAKTKERPKGEIGTIEDTGLNLKIYGDQDILIDNNIARAQVKVDLLLRGTVLQPVILGRVESISGNVYFRNNEFRIVRASADFSDPRRINPVMGIIAETSIKGYNIRLNLEGQLDHFNLSLLSDPPLPEIDILSLLTVGKFGKELKGIESGIGAGEATSFLTGKMQDIIEERVRTLTGLDRLEVDPYVSKTTGTVSPRITVSKRLLGDKLFVTYSSAVGTAESNVLKLEYLLNKNISLIGVRDEKGGIGGDIKFRFEFK